MEAEFNSLRAFDFDRADVYLWVFKKSQGAKRYSARYVPIDEQLKITLQNLIRSEMNRITEFSEYSYISQTNENSCLVAEKGGTDFEFLKAQVDKPEPECLVKGIKDLKGAQGYVVKYSNNDETVYAVKRSTSTWKTSYPRKYINMLFVNGELSAAEDNAFAIERNFDFFCKEELIFISAKRNFESTLACKVAYQEVFSELQESDVFTSLFVDMQPIIAYVGNNAIQLRRMAVVEQKAVYAIPGFLVKLKRVNDAEAWGINFDPATNKIVACNLTAKTIMQILLDHRLRSEITENTYDVPDATKV